MGKRETKAKNEWKCRESNVLSFESISHFTSHYLCVHNMEYEVCNACNRVMLYIIFNAHIRNLCVPLNIAFNFVQLNGIFPFPLNAIKHCNEQQRFWLNISADQFDIYTKYINICLCVCVCTLSRAIISFTECSDNICWPNLRSSITSVLIVMNFQP